MTARLTSFTKQPSIDTYLEEWRRIREVPTGLTVPGQAWPGPGEDEHSDIEENVGGIDTDPDAIWLENAGFGSIVCQLQRNDDMEGGDILTGVLPRKHEAVVRKRMNTLRSTLRRQRDGEKKSSGSRSDVRNIFNSAKTSPTKSSGVITTSVRPLPGTRVNGSPRVSPSPHNSPASSPRASPTPSRHLPLSPAHSTGVSTHSSLTTTSTSSGSRHGSVPAPAGNRIGRQQVLVRGSESISERDRHKGFKIRPKHAHHQSSDSGIVSRDSSSSNEYLNEGHFGTGSPEPPVPSKTNSEGSNNYNHRPSPPSELRVPDLSPASSTDSPTQEDIKLDFRTQQFSVVNETHELPNFMVMPDALGITHISDLSPGDMDKVRSVALVELTITFEDHNLPLRPRRPLKLKNIPENSVFGVPLSTLLQTDQQRVPGTQIPLIFEEMISHLEKNCLDDEGILRVPGNSARLQSQKQEIESKFNQRDFSFDGLKSSDVCSLLKMFIRELPVSLLTREYLPAFASIPDIDDLKEQVRTLNLLVLLLPTVHQMVLKRMLIFLERVTEHSSINKMDLLNVSMVTAPNLFMSLPSRHTLDDVSMASKTSQVVRLLIKYHRLLWTVPGEMLRQIRYLYEIEMKKFSTRSVQKALKQMQNHLTKGSSQTALQETAHTGPHIVKVKAPLYTRVCMAVDVTHGMTAGDIVAKLQKRSRLNKDLIKRRVSGTNFSEAYFLQSQGRSVSPVDELRAAESDQNGDTNGVLLGEQFVFEVGGNIGERCLAHDTDMCSLYKVNPQAQWVIKPRDWPDI